MFSIRRITAVAKKEFLEIIRNKLGFILTIIAPVMIFFLFAYGLPLDVKHIPMALLDEDKTNESRKLADVFENNNIFDIKQMLSSFDEMDKIIRLGDVRVCLVIPGGFEKNIQRGKPQNIFAFVDATWTNRASIIGGYIDLILASFNAKIITNFSMKKFGANKDKSEPVRLFINPWFNPTLRSEDFMLPGVIAIVLIFLPPIIAAISITKEKETGSILNMYCSALSKTEYIIGKSLPYIILTYFNFILYLIFTISIFDVPLRGSLPLLLIVSLIYIAGTIAIGLFVAVLVNSQIAAILIVSIATMLTSSMYSGYITPVNCMEQNAQSIAKMLLPTYYIDFTRKLMVKGVGLDYLSGDVLCLIAISLILYSVTIILFKKKLG